MRKPLLAEAISKRHMIELRYDGFTRLVEPHAYGIDSSGSEKLRCWQISGGSTSGERQGWKLLNVSDMHATTLSEAKFASARAGYKRGDSAMRHIYAQL